MQIVYKESFVIRLEKQLNYISTDNPSAAKRFKKDLVAKIKAIPTHPKSHRKSIYFDDENIRDLIFKGYTIVYRITSHQIEIFGLVKYQENPTD